MPIVRKITGHGGSRGVTLPASWINLIEKESGKKLTEVLMEVNGEITIKPYLSAEKQHPCTCSSPKKGEEPCQTASI